MNGDPDKPTSVPPPHRPENGGSWWQNVEQRLGNIETELKHLASKKDLSDMKVWILVGVLTGIAASIGVVAAIATAAASIIRAMA